MTNNYMYLVANWKMNGHLSSLKQIKKVISLSSTNLFKRKVKIIYCPPFTLLSSFVDKTLNSKIKIGAQDCHYVENYGSYTGEISPNQIKKLGVKYVIIGHSEKRFSGDTDFIINKKVKSALNQNLNIILCIGETFKQKKEKKTKIILSNQIKKSLKNIKNLKNIIIAYEPVWSIGSGKIPSIKELNSTLSHIKNIIIKKFKYRKISLLYGGSVNPENIKHLMKTNNINGFLVGGSSQIQKKFIDIAKKIIN